MKFVGSYRELVQQAYDSLKTDLPDAEEPRPEITPETAAYMQKQFDTIRCTLGTTVDEILAKRKVLHDPFDVLDALFTFACHQFLHGVP